MYIEYIRERVPFKTQDSIQVYETASRQLTMLTIFSSLP